MLKIIIFKTRLINLLQMTARGSKEPLIGHWVVHCAHLFTHMP